MATVTGDVITAQARRVPQPYAGIVTRGVAFVLDALIINAATIVLAAAAALVLSVIVPGDLEPGWESAVAGLCTWWVAGAAYFVGFWTLTGQTPGMRAMRLRVTDATGDRPHLGRSLIRLVGLILAAIPLMAGYALILFDRRRQGLQDKLAGTFVRHVPPPPATRGAYARARTPAYLLGSTPGPPETAIDLEPKEEEE
jgi:uncharacterized RDD family membrane protein YckC